MNIATPSAFCVRGICDSKKQVFLLEWYKSFEMEAKFHGFEGL